MFRPLQGHRRGSTAEPGLARGPRPERRGRVGGGMAGRVETWGEGSGRAAGGGSDLCRSAPRARLLPLHVRLTCFLSLPQLRGGFAPTPGS